MYICSSGGREVKIETESCRQEAIAEKENEEGHEKEMKPCCRKDCPNEGVWQPVLLFTPAPDIPPSRAFLNLWICDEHRLSSTVKDFLSDEVYAKIVRSVDRQRLVIPKRELTKIDFVKEDMFNRI